MLGIDLNGIEAARHETRMHVLTEPCCINVARIEHQAVVLSVHPQRVDGFDKTFHQSVEAPLFDRCIDACRWERQHFDAPTVLFGTASEFTVHVLPLFWTEAPTGDAKILENADVGFRTEHAPMNKGLMQGPRPASSTPTTRIESLQIEIVEQRVDLRRFVLGCCKVGGQCIKAFDAA